MTEQEQVFGSVRRWRDGDILWAENNWARMAYVPHSDPAVQGTIGLHGPEDMCVQFISPGQAARWPS